VSVDIRSYRNTDSQALCRVFNAHYQAVGLSCVLTPLSLELCVLAKPYFVPELLLVAEVDGTVAGFAQLGFAPDATLQTLSTTQAILSALCVPVQPNSTEIAAQLIAAAMRIVSQCGAVQLRFSPPPPASPFFAGLALGDGMIGAPSTDTRLHAWLTSAGWKADERVVYWEVDLANFHPPMDRMQIQIRRMASVERLLDEPMLPWYVASMLGHTEQIKFQLANRDTQSIAADIVLWTIGHELLPQPDTIVRLWPLASEVCRRNEDHLVFLLAEAFRQMREDRVDVVRTVASDKDADVSRLLRRMGFDALISGNVFSSAV
jgi:hypothetical protein